MFQIALTLTSSTPQDHQRSKHCRALEVSRIVRSSVKRSWLVSILSTGERHYSPLKCYQSAVYIKPCLSGVIEKSASWKGKVLQTQGYFIQIPMPDCLPPSGRHLDQSSAQKHVRSQSGISLSDKHLYNILYRARICPTLGGGRGCRQQKSLDEWWRREGVAEIRESPLWRWKDIIWGQPS